jgi:hypothetical protein
VEALSHGEFNLMMIDFELSKGNTIRTAISEVSIDAAISVLDYEVSIRILRVEQNQ